ncbi:polysaccharide deacetylase family protein [Catalinimonas niigatensis]|uniref:polysaccharide deacetylase family protein n=1 Tax=Catalinimonas niigatensis TaxID=1397264 RepID=UPI002665D1A6|nr:polysaccharide deacetylase family protein [Catalinimonas niigatensis]WPP51206.1 polysaccharide deacetylase family protein [Catalinimonas niigatensis]
MDYNLSISLIKNKIFFLGIVLLFVSCASQEDETVGQTEITPWQGDKQSAISITYDDGTIHQFTVARPIMNKLGFPGTFYIITGKVEGSAKGKFIGRPKEEVIRETVSVQTNEQNFFERASLIAYTGMEGAVDYHTQAGVLFESGRVEEAYALMDEAYGQLRSQNMGDLEADNFHNNTVDTTTWEDYKSYAAEGHEIASHTVTHPRLAVLDEANMRYELEQSKADIQKYLGEEYTFSAECPYGTEDERVMEYAHTIYPALRNRMPAPYLEELNRSSKTQPGASDKEYVQWQRGPLTSVSMETMKSWVDTSIAHNNIWLVLVFHGVDGIGWEPRTGAELEEYFSYMKERESDLWVATFADVTKYIRERKGTEVNASAEEDRILINLSSDLDTEVYNVPLTLKTYVPEDWNTVFLQTAGKEEDQSVLEIQQDEQGYYVLYTIRPDEKEVVLAAQSQD